MTAAERVQPAPIYFWDPRGESKSTECVQDIAIYPGLSSECGIWHPDILAIIPTNEFKYDSKGMIGDALGGSIGHFNLNSKHGWVTFCPETFCPG